MIIPDEHWPPWSDLSEIQRFDALMAVLGSGLVSCLIDENEPTRNISTRRIASIPFPNDEVAIRALAGTGRQVSEAVAAADDRRIATADRQLEATIRRIYRLPPNAQAVIAKRLAGAPGFDSTVRYPVERVSDRDISEERLPVYLPSFGHVIEAGEDGLVLWISGLTQPEGRPVPALPQLPGWLCEGGSDFRIEGDLSNLDTAQFGFHTYDWLTEDELTRPDGLAQ